ncbi:hypothetical protein [Streptomyces erythrochromogenes]|nr:hypothetical protein OG489_00265 [Streptomyces erythrochromogenes]WSR88315.1 hypothetical protein OG489_39695 [Streptomyces erythrochromogenes]
MDLNDGNDPRKSWWERLKETLRRAGPWIALAANSVTVCREALGK